MVRAGWMMLIWLPLVGCGGGGGADGGGGGASGGDAGGGRNSGRPVFVLPTPTPPPDPRLARLAGYEAQKTRVLGGSGSGFAGLSPTTADLPVQGRVDFAGFASLRVEGGPVLTLFGDARLDVDFSSQQISGTVDNLFGTSPAGGAADYAGALAISGAAVQPELLLDYSGALSAAGRQLDVTGMLEAAFLGDPIQGLSGIDLASQVIRDGQAQLGTFLIVMERDGKLPH